MKVVKTVAAVAAIAGLAVVTGGAALGLGVSLGTTAFGVSAGALLTTSSALSIGASLLQRPKAPSTSPAATDRLTANIDPRTARKMVFGTTAFATDLRDQEYTGADQDQLHRFFVCASHQVANYREIWLDDKLAWSASGGIASEFLGYLGVECYTVGTAANAKNISGRMGASRRYTGLAWVYLRFKTTGNSKKAESPFAQSIPSRVTIVGDGALVYDPRFDSSVPGGNGPQRANDQATWAWNEDSARNPALQLLWYLLGWRIQNPVTGTWKLAVGKGVPAARINIESFITAANLCDEAVALAGGGTQPRYRSDGLFSESDATGTVLDQLKAAMNAELDDVDGKIRITVLHNDLAAPIADLTTDDVIGAFKWDQTAPIDQNFFNVVRGTFVDPSSTSLFQPVDYPEVRIPSPDGIDRVETIDFQTVQNSARAQRLVKQIVARMLYSGTFTATFSHRAWKVQKNDVIRLTFAPLGWTNKLFRVAEHDVQIDGQVPMVLREEHPDIYLWDRDERPAIQSVEPTRYDPYNNPVYQGIAEAGDSAIWDNITGAGKPEDDATVGGTIGLDIYIPEIPDIPAPPGLLRNDLLKLRTDGQLVYQPYGDPAVEVELGKIDLADIGATSDAERRRLDNAIDRLGAAVTQALSEASKTRETFRDAGVYVDPVTGIVKISAIEQTAERVSEAYIRLSAAESSIALRATRTYVDNAISVAVLDPSQIPVFELLEVRITDAELRIDGAEASISQKASVVDLSAQGARLTEAEINIDALEGQIVLKVESSDFSALGERVASAEQTLEAIGDTASLTQVVSVARRLPTDIGDTNERILRTLLAGDAARRGQLDALASARNELTAKINDDRSAEAGTLQQLVVKVGAVEASAVLETQARVEGDRAVTKQVTDLSASIGGDLANFDQRIITLVDKDNLISAGLTETISALRGVGENADAAVESALRGLLTGDKSGRDLASAIAAAREEVTVKINADVDAVAQRVSAVLVRMGAAEASILSIELLRATAELAIVSRISQMTASIDENTADIRDEEIARADAVSAQAGRIDTIVSRIGEEDAPGSIEAKIEEAATTYVADLQAQAGRIDTISARIGAPGAADSIEARIEAAATVYADPLLAQAERIDSVNARLGAPGAAGSIEAQVASAANAYVTPLGAQAARTDNVIARIGVEGDPNSIEAKVEDTREVLADVEGKLTARVRIAATAGDTVFLELVADGHEGSIIKLGGNVLALGVVTAENFVANALIVPAYVYMNGPLAGPGWDSGDTGPGGVGGGTGGGGGPGGGEIP
tara:strand:- start:31449 stop:35321 length:3873 start_codon:yes stop_codon:yes gene_type:complete